MIEIESSKAVPLRVDGGGTIRVGDTRVSLDSIVYGFMDGATAKEICDSFPSLKLSQVYEAIAYYLDHKEEVDPYLRERERQAEEQRRLWEQDPESAELRQRLLRRMTAQST